MHACKCIWSNQHPFFLFCHTSCIGHCDFRADPNLIKILLFGVPKSIAISQCTFATTKPKHKHLKFNKPLILPKGNTNLGPGNHFTVSECGNLVGSVKNQRLDKKKGDEGLLVICCFMVSNSVSRENVVNWYAYVPVTPAKSMMQFNSSQGIATLQHGFAMKAFFIMQSFLFGKRAVPVWLLPVLKSRLVCICWRLEVLFLENFWSSPSSTWKFFNFVSI